MSEFIQLHLLTAYPPSNLNRDDLGRPKTALIGGVQRLRVSSQSLKRAWRTSDLFRQIVDNHVGIRTKEFGNLIYERLVRRGMAEELADGWARFLVEGIGKAKSEKPRSSETLVFFDETEIRAAESFCDDLGLAEVVPKGKTGKDQLKQVLRKRVSSVDLAMFGRMLAQVPEYNIDAAVQVSHAFSVNKAVVEDDYFTAVDDLNSGEEDAGAGHVGEAEFGAGLFYTYVCVNKTLLEENLSEDGKSFVGPSLRALCESAAKVAPGGKQNSFASRAYASYLLAEKGSGEPRSLGFAFFEPVYGQSPIGEAIRRLEEHRNNLEKAYGRTTDSHLALNAFAGTGNLEAILDFVAGE